MTGAPDPSVAATDGHPAEGSLHLAIRRAGHAWVVHPRGLFDQRSWMFAAGLAEDPELSLVVVDLPPDTPYDALSEVTRVLPLDAPGFRIVFGRNPPGGTAAAAMLLASAAGRDVVVADGRPHPACDGALFVSSDRGAGWVRYAAAGGRTVLGRRFPRPAWEPSPPDEPWFLTERAVAEPIAAGIWLRQAEETTEVRSQRAFLTSRLRAHPESITIVLGAPGLDAVRLPEVTALWRALPQDTRAKARILPFGEIALPHGVTLKSALAESVGQAGQAVRLNDHAQADAAAEASSPDSREPLLGREEIAEFPPPVREEEHYASNHFNEADHTDSHSTSAADQELPSGSPPLQSFFTDSSESHPGEPAFSLPKEYESEYRDSERYVGTLVQRHPDLLGGRAPRTVVRNLTLLRLLISSNGEIWNAVTATNGEAHDMLLWCLTDGLRRLPVYHGPAAVRGSLTQETWTRYRIRNDFYGQNPFAASLTGTPGSPGSTDFVVHAVNARRTALLEPGKPDLVIFLPNTRFSVLKSGTGRRDFVLLREIDTAEGGSPVSDADALKESSRALLEWQRDEESGVVRPLPQGPLFHPPGLSAPAEPSPLRRAP